MAKSKSAAEVMGELINKGEPGKAWQYGCRVADDSPDRSDANFWFMAVLAARMIGRVSDTLIRQYMAKAAACPNYSQEMEGDFHRDGAIALIKLGEIKKASAELDRAVVLHEGNPNREAAIWAVRARIDFARGHYSMALEKHQTAAQLWDDLAELGQFADPTWITNNKFHELRTAVFVQNEYAAAIAEKDFQHVMAHSKSRRQRNAARMAHRFGQRGVKRLKHY